MMASVSPMYPQFNVTRRSNARCWGGEREREKRETGAPPKGDAQGSVAVLPDAAGDILVAAPDSGPAFLSIQANLAVVSLMALIGHERRNKRTDDGMWCTSEHTAADPAAAA